MAEDWELEQAKEDARALKDQYERLQRGQALLVNEQLNQAASQAIQDGVMEACKDMGIDPAQFGQIFHSDPQKAIEVQKKQAKRYAEKIIKSAIRKQGMVRDAKSGQYVKASPGQVSGVGSNSDLRGIAENARAGKLDSNKALDKMIDIALRDFFEQGLKR